MPKSNYLRFVPAYIEQHLTLVLPALKTAILREMRSFSVAIIAAFDYFNK